MTWALKGVGGTVVSGTANQASIVLGTATTNMAAGDFGLFIVAGDNAASTDGDEGMVTSVTDSAGNAWLKAVEFCNSQGSSGAGSTCSLWYTNAKAALNTANSITAAFSFPTARDQMCAAFRIYTKQAGAVGRVAGTNTLANDAADPGSLNVTTENKAYLRVRAISSEVNSTGTITATGGWTSWGYTIRSANNAAAQTLRGEELISTATGAASDPTWTSADHASVYAAFEEVMVAGFLGTEATGHHVPHLRHFEVIGT